jgi:hypothetical protein
VAPDKGRARPVVPRAALQTTQDDPRQGVTAVASVADPGDCACGCCQQLIRALAGIKAELSRIRERLDGVESGRAWSP